MVMKKPEGSQWTDEQWQAITEENHDLLVAAAAGSGKTAVLVERIIRKILSPDRQTGIDDLLVVTFTNAAAAEMRERIGRALDQQIIAHPEDAYLRKQQALLSKASIMTLHAFCLSVLKKNYYDLDIDPNFRLLDETEAGLLREEVLDEVLEDHYSSGDAGFYRLVDQYSGDRSDELIRSLILRIYNFSLSHPWPEHWLDSLPAAYQQDEGKSIDDFSWTRELKKVFFLKVSGAAAALRGALAVCGAPGGPDVYIGTLTEDISRLSGLMTLKTAGWEKIRSAVSTFAFPKLRAASGKNYDSALKDQVRKTREQVKKMIAGYQQDWFARDSNELLQDVRDMAPSVSLLVRLVRQFAGQFSAEKQSRGVLDFSDLEHQCLTVLRADDAVPGSEKPSAVALQYRKRFAEVLVDEYQDTNRVQEAILRLIKKNGAEGNLFMVGDVKQSIYGFRLAEPGLFTEKYKTFSESGSRGAKIDLSSNFRSRREIISGTNYLFRQIMDGSSGGVDYDRAAELKFGATYPDGDRPVDLELIDRSQSSPPDQDTDEDSEDYNATELEAAAVSDRIRAMVGDGSNPAFQVCDRERRQMRPLHYRDIAILMRSATTSAAVMKDVLSSHGIPAYAELTKGYFDTVEVSVMLSVLQMIDNPFQDIPLASVLRSPIVGLNGDELARIRLSREQVPYFTALKAYVKTHKDELGEKLLKFLEQLTSWQDYSKAHAVSGLIWQIYRDTGYYDYAGGLFGGTQRQANLKAFYDRARLYEKTSFRGLFRFLRFISRMRDTGGDLGEARALSEQEDVVRIMTIHKSKGLEFPVVFLVGIDRKFNRKDLSGPALLHKTLGFGTRWIDPEQRISVPTLPYLAIQERLAADSVAEEMRILYVAVTRAREKLILVGSVKDPEKRVRQWASVLDDREWLLPDDMRRTATTFLDWIGPCLMRHRQATVLHELCGRSPDRTTVSLDASVWNVTVIPASELEVRPAVHPEEESDRLKRLREWRAVVSHSGLQDEIRRRLEWKDPHRRAARYMAKQTVTEIKSQQDYFSEGLDDRLMTDRLPAIGKDRPHFLQQEGRLSPTERGTAMHILMQHLDLSVKSTVENIRMQGLELVKNEILTAEQEASLDYQTVSAFFSTDIGRSMKNGSRVLRECPFSLTLPAGDVYPDWGKGGPDSEERVLIQGVIDCIIENEAGLTLLDYKTDKITERFPEPAAAKAELKKRYQLQLGLYRIAVERIWKRPVTRLGLYAFDGGLFVDLTEEKDVFS